MHWLQQGIKSSEINPVACWHSSILLCSPHLLLQPVSCPAPPSTLPPFNPPQLWLSSLWTNFVIGPQTAAGEQPRPTKATWECNMWSCVTRDQGFEPHRGAKIKPESIDMRETKKGKQTPIWNNGTCCCYLSGYAQSLHALIYEFVFNSHFFFEFFCLNNRYLKYIFEGKPLSKPWYRC